MFRTVGDAAEVRRAVAPLERASTIEHVLEVPPVRMTTVPGFETAVFPYTTDIPFLSGWGQPLLFGPGSIHVAHTADEYVSIAELNAAVDHYVTIARALLSSRLSGPADMTSPRAEYERRIASMERADRGRRAAPPDAFEPAAWRRAAGAALLLWLTVGRWTMSPAWLLVPGLCFIALVVWHARVHSGNERAGAQRLYERGLARIDGRGPAAAPTARGFGADHPYARDLDLFGRGSLFELLEHGAHRNRRGDAGRLAACAGAGADGDRAPGGGRRAAADARFPRRRRGARRRSRRRPDGRARGMGSCAAGRVSALAPAPCSSHAPSSRSRSLPRAYAGVDRVGLGSRLLFLSHRSVASGSGARRWRTCCTASRPPSAISALLAALLARIEREPFTSPRLVALRDALLTRRRAAVATHRAAAAAGVVARLDAQPDVRADRCGAARAAAAGGRDRSLASRVRPARSATGSRAVGELEALSALATLRLRAPGRSVSRRRRRRAAASKPTALGHPLIPEADRRSRNDVRLGGDASSRTDRQRIEHVGQEHAAARGRRERRAGAGRRAGARRTRCGCRRSCIGATLRIEDSLQAGHSRFYAEILRIRAIVERAARRDACCCSCSTRSCTAPIRTIAGSAPKRSSARWSGTARSASSRRTISR